MRSAWPLLLAGCLTSHPLGPILPQNPGEGARCKAAVSQGSPLVTEWPAPEKANLEALLMQGTVAVAYSGCSMRVLPQCRPRGHYIWQHTTPTADVISINNEDELYAKLPLGAVSLEGELKRSGKLEMQTVVSGQVRLIEGNAGDVPADGECAQATHVLGALSVGAFTLSRGAEGSAKASASVSSFGEAGGKGSRAQNLMRAAGVPDSCGESTDEAPHPNCRSPIQAFLWAIPGRGQVEGPPGTVRTDFVSASANGRWDVYIDDQVACTTPCTKFVDPNRPILLRAREDSMFTGPDKIQLAGLGDGAAAGSVQLQAHPTARGELATGITLTSFGGLGVLTGITLAAVGCPNGISDGQCVAGLSTFGLGGLLTAGAIWLILDAMPRADIVPGVRAWLAPGGIAGVF
jgi:hypothetical protein